VLLAGILPHVERKLAAPDERTRAYKAFLAAIAQWGLLDRFSAVGPRPLRVAMPFCGQLGEAPILLPFLVDRLLGRLCGPTCLEVCGCDVLAEPEAFWWPAWREWATQTFGDRVRLAFQRQDLCSDPLPPADLILGVHPAVLEAIARCSGPGQAASDPGVMVEVKPDGPWHDILVNVLRAREVGSLCMFATFYLSEARAVEAILQGLGVASEIRENPHYVGAPVGAQDTHLRFAVIVGP